MPEQLVIDEEEKLITADDSSENIQWSEFVTGQQLFLLRGKIAGFCEVLSLFLDETVISLFVTETIRIYLRMNCLVTLTE